MMNFLDFIKKIIEAFTKKKKPEEVISVPSVFSADNTQGSPFTYTVTTPDKLGVNANTLSAQTITIVATETKPGILTTIDNKEVYLVDKVLCYRSGMMVDADGAPTAYHPNPGLGLDYLANAGDPKNNKWWGIITDKKGIPVVQGPNDPAPGYYISPTSLTDPKKAATDPTKYVDSSTIPYIAVPPQLRDHGLKLGDLCMVMYKNFSCPAIVADFGPKKRIGEGSVALAKNLFINFSARNGGVEKGVTYLIFCGTSKGWPRDKEEMAKEAGQLYAEFTKNHSVTDILGG